MTTRIIGPVRDLEGAILPNRKLQFERRNGVRAQDGATIVPMRVEVKTDENGEIDVEIYPGEYQGRVSTGSAYLMFKIGVPESSEPVQLQDLVDQVPKITPMLVSEAREAKDDAQAAAGEAEASATSASDSATSAGQSATIADQRATDAENAAQSASEDASATAADRVATGEDAQATAADRVATGEDRQAVAEDRTATEAAKDTAEGAATAAGQSATDAGESAAQSEAWATGTEPGGVGTLSSREWAEEAEARAEALPDPAGDAGRLIETDGAGGYAVMPYSGDSVLRAARADIGFHPDIWLAWDDCSPPITQDTLVDDLSVSMSSGHRWERAPLTSATPNGGDTTELLYDTEGYIRGGSNLPETAHVISGISPVYVDMSFYAVASSSSRYPHWVPKYLNENNFLYLRLEIASFSLLKVEDGAVTTLASATTVNDYRRFYNRSPVQWRIEMLFPSIRNVTIRIFESGLLALSYTLTDDEESLFAVPATCGFFGRFDGHKIYGVTVKQGGPV